MIINRFIHIFNIFVFIAVNFMWHWIPSSLLCSDYVPLTNLSSIIYLFYFVRSSHILSFLLRSYISYFQYSREFDLIFFLSLIIIVITNCFILKTHSTRFNLFCCPFYKFIYYFHSENSDLTYHFVWFNYCSSSFFHFDAEHFIELLLPLLLSTLPYEHYYYKWRFAKMVAFTITVLVSLVCWVA